MSQHYKKLGFKTPENYFQKSKNQILATTINNENKIIKQQTNSYFQLLVAAIFITSLLYLNFSNLNTNSPIISTILSDKEITDEYIVDFLTDIVVINEFKIPK
jgi:hypothetical protein